MIMYKCLNNVDQSQTSTIRVQLMTILFKLYTLDLFVVLGSDIKIIKYASDFVIYTSHKIYSIVKYRLDNAIKNTEVVIGK